MNHIESYNMETYRYRYYIESYTESFNMQWKHINIDIHKESNRII